MMAFGSLCIGVAFVFEGPPESLQNSIPASVTTTVICNSIAYMGIAFVMSPVPKALLISLRSCGYRNSIATGNFIATTFNGMWYLGGCFGPTISGALIDSIGFPMTSVLFASLAFILTIVLVICEIMERSNYCGKRKSKFREYAAKHETSKTQSLFYSQRI